MANDFFFVLGSAWVMSALYFGCMKNVLGIIHLFLILWRRKIKLFSICWLLLFQTRLYRLNRFCRHLFCTHFFPPFYLSIYLEICCCLINKERNETKQNEKKISCNLGKLWWNKKKFKIHQNKCKTCKCLHACIHA